MKCNAILVYVTEGKRPLVFGATATEALIEKHTQKYEITSRETCGGRIVARVEAINEPVFGGTYAKLEVSYKCQKCGWTGFEDLPREYGLSEWLTQKIAEL